MYIAYSVLATQEIRVKVESYSGNIVGNYSQGTRQGCWYECFRNCYSAWQLGCTW